VNSWIFVLGKFSPSAVRRLIHSPTALPGFIFTVYNAQPPHLKGCARFYFYSVMQHNYKLQSDEAQHHAVAWCCCCVLLYKQCG
jgi:hypothetical protein